MVMCELLSKAGQDSDLSKPAIVLGNDYSAHLYDALNGSLTCRMRFDSVFIEPSCNASPSVCVCWICLFGVGFFLCLSCVFLSRFSYAPSLAHSCM